MLEQIVDCDLRALRDNAGQVALEAVVEPEFFLIDQLQHERCGERLGDAASSGPVGTPCRSSHRPKPVVAAVNGPAVGIGCSLALASDLIVASRRAYFLLAFVNIGLVPDGGSSVFVPARAGFTRAMQMSMLGERIGAEKALEWGLINQVVDDAELSVEVGTLIDRLAAGPTRSYAGAKRQLNARAYAGIEQQLELEAQIQQQQATTADFIEGVTAFAEKRPAHFTGQ